MVSLRQWEEPKAHWAHAKHTRSLSTEHQEGAHTTLALPSQKAFANIEKHLCLFP